MYTYTLPFNVCEHYLQLRQLPWQVQGLHFDEGVLLRDGPLSRRSVVICTRLGVFGGVYAVPLGLRNPSLQTNMSVKQAWAAKLSRSAVTGNSEQVKRVGALH